MKILYGLLANTYNLYLKTQNFISMHLLFEKQYFALPEAVDVIAEFMRTFNVKVKANLEKFIEYDMLPISYADYSCAEMVDDLIQSHNKIIGFIELAIVFAKKHNEIVMENILTDRLTEHKKFLWMLNSINKK